MNLTVLIMYDDAKTATESNKSYTIKQKIPLAGVSLLVWTVILHNLNSWCKNGPICTVLMVT